jgi:hypothetical protein
MVDDKSMEVLGTFDMGTLIRAIDTMGDLMIVGLRSGDVQELTMSTGDKKTLV